MALVVGIPRCIGRSATAVWVAALVAADAAFGEGVEPCAPANPAWSSSPAFASQDVEAASPLRPVAGAFPQVRAAVPLSRAEELGLRPKDVFKECADCPEMVVVCTENFIRIDWPGESPNVSAHDRAAVFHLCSLPPPHRIAGRIRQPSKGSKAGWRRS